MSRAKSTKKLYQAPALDKGLDILEYLAGETFPRSQAEILQALGRNQSEIYRMLACLESRGYIVKESESGRYHLTLRMYQLSHQQHGPSLLRKAAQLPMESLAEQTGQSCHLSVQHGAELLVILEQRPTRQICLSVGEGKSYPMVHTASGKVLLARMQPDAMEQVLKRDTAFTRQAVASRKVIYDLIDKIQDAGYHVEASELTQGATDIAIPVGVAGTDTSAVLAITYLSSKGDNRKTRREFLKAAQACADEIDRNLGIKP